jgi:23S rRNA pseudouridine1911/1915/1917 synthase
MVVVKNVRAAQRISKQIQERTVTKKYWAVVEGDVPEDFGTWTDWVRKIPDEAKSEIVDRDHADAKSAILHFRILRRASRLSLIEIELETGRTHQIRLQLASRGLPIVGDELYGAQLPFGPETSDLRKRWIALHSRRLAFVHPISGEPIDQTAPIPDHWRSFETFATELFSSDGTV